MSRPTPHTRERATWAWSGCVAALGALLLLGVARDSWPADSGQAMLACALVALYGETRSVYIRGFGVLSLAEPVYFAQALVLGPGPAALTAVPVGFVSGILLRKRPVVRLFNLGWAAIVFVLTGLLYRALGSPDPLTPSGAGAAVAAALVYGATAGVLQAVGQSYFEDMPLRDTLGELRRGVAYIVASALALGLLAVLLLRLGPGWLVVMALPVEVFSGYVSQTRLNRELSQTLQRLRDAQAALVQSEKRAAAGLLAAGVAHEINNPLAAIAMNCHLLRGQLRDRSLEGHLDLIDRATERCRRITGQLLVYARPPRDRGPCDVGRALEETLLLMGRSLREDGVEVTGPPAGFWVQMPQGPLMQVLANLLQNAHLAIGGPGRIAVQASREGGRVTVRVSDTGAGVPEEVRDRIFDAFFTTRPVGQGTGLGLSLVRSMVEEAGGTVDLERSGPDGSVFRVVLPEGAT